MTEAEWLASVDPAAMLRHVCGESRGVRELMAPRLASDRKLRLFAVACCRAVWLLLTDARSRRAVEVAERFADGEATEGERNKADWAAATPSGMRVDTPEWMAHAVCGLTSAAEAAFEVVRIGIAPPTGLAGLLRDIVGNPFLRPVASPMPPHSHIRSDLWGLAYGLAREAYQERAQDDGPLDADRLAVLADALEEAGCDSRELLGHLRTPGPHVRGCWAVDLVLGRE